MNAHLLWTPIPPNAPTDFARFRFSAREAAEGERLRTPRGRAEWFAGRLLARAAWDVAERDRGETFESLMPRFVSWESLLETVRTQDDREILSRNAAWHGTAPRLLQEGLPYPGTLSISHTDGIAAVLFAAESDVSCGLDIVRPGRFGRGFAEMWFPHADESAWRNGQAENAWRSDGAKIAAWEYAAETIACGWSIKEAAYKACRPDGPFVPERFRLPRRPAEEGIVTYHPPEGATIEVRWGSRRTEDFRWTWALREDVFEATARAGRVGGRLVAGAGKERR